jgi:hypothetical protein
MDLSRHDPDLALPGCNNPRTVRSNEAALLPLEETDDVHHVQDRNPLGNTDNDRDLRIRCLQNGIGSERGRDHNHGCVNLMVLKGPFHSIVNRDLINGLPLLARCHPGHNMGPVLHALTGMKSPLLTGDSLDENIRVFINE